MLKCTFYVCKNMCNYKVNEKAVQGGPCDDAVNFGKYRLPIEVYSGIARFSLR